ncbi:MAG: ABC transporter substrate-binding protein [Thermomicrobiales bacterium]
MPDSLTPARASAAARPQSRAVSRRALVQAAAGLSLAAGAGRVLAPGAARAAQADPAGKIVISLNAEPSTLEWWNAYSIDGHPILRNIFEALLNRDPATNELVGELAESWEWTDDRTIRFKLREGITYHNGDPLTAEDAAFGINYTWDPENAFDIAQFMGSQITATAVDDLTLDVQTADPDPLLPAVLYFAPLPSARQIKEAPDTLVTEPIGTGPYSFVAWSRGEQIDLTAFPEWWGNTYPDTAYGAQAIKDVEYVWRPESSVRAAQVSTGEAQLGRFLSPEDCATTPVCKEAISVETVPLRLDTVHPTLSDIRVRQAISHAIDRQAVVDELFASGAVASQLVGPSAAGYNAELEPVSYDPELARQLVQEAAADGVPIDLPLIIAVRQGVYLRAEELGEYVAGALNEIGLNATTEVIEYAAYMEQYIMPYEDIPEDRGWIGTMSHGNEMMDVGLTAATWYRCSGGVASYCDPELDAAIDAANPLVGDERAAAFADITRRFQEAYSVAPILHLAFLYGTADTLNWEPRLDGFMLVKEMSLTS